MKLKTQTLAVTKVIRSKKGAKSFKKYFGMNKPTGKITVKKGSYKVKIKIRALGNTDYKASGVKPVTFTVKVK